MKASSIRTLWTNKFLVAALFITTTPERGWADEFEATARRYLMPAVWSAKTQDKTGVGRAATPVNKSTGNKDHCSPHRISNK